MSVMSRLSGFSMYKPYKSHDVSCIVLIYLFIALISEANSVLNHFIPATDAFVGHEDNGFIWDFRYIFYIDQSKYT